MEAPRLAAISTADFVSFKHGREVYERRVAEKNADPNVQIQLTTYKDSITPAILEILALGDWVPVDTVELITENNLKDCVLKHTNVDPDDYHFGKLKDELKYVKLGRADNENNLESQVRRLILEYTKILQKCGYEEFAERHPKIAVEHVLKRISHPFMRNRMLMTAGMKEGEGFRENFRAFVREVSKEAVSLTE